MSRRNRRRTRGRHKVFTSYQNEAFELPCSTNPSESKLLDAGYAGQSDLCAKYWHNRYQAWQARLGPQKAEWERLKEKRRRIFGGDIDDDEDDGLCIKMMDYFMRLDYLKG